MNITPSLLSRCESKCELCGATSDLEEYIVPPKTGSSEEEIAVICATCKDQIAENTEMNINHWRCLNESMWSQIPAVQVLAYRMLKKLSEEGWALDLLNMMYLDEENLEWAQTGSGPALVHKDSNGNVLENGDTVTLIQDLNVKGANFTAKRGTAVRRIRLDPENEAHIEGKVDGQQIVILTKYVKKA